MHKRLPIARLVLLAALPLCAHASVELPDPTRPSFASDTVVRTGVEFKVTAIFVSDQRRHAVINGQVVTIGDQVDGAKVIEIREDGLDLFYRGEAITRRLLTLEVRK